MTVHAMPIVADLAAHPERVNELDSATDVASLGRSEGTMACVSPLVWIVVTGVATLFWSDTSMTSSSQSW